MSTNVKQRHKESEQIGNNINNVFVLGENNQSFYSI